ncbi:hypothetical protein PUN4_430095 [Paraburkholderia unamae]|nr:hypothetical protein PUN4_430095 [Paraburkholderia unamae]
MAFGAGDESRTRDLNLGKVALYQLSYSRKCPAFYCTALLLRHFVFLPQKRRTLKSGAGDESRTRDLNLGKVALYQLSYSRILLPISLNYRLSSAISTASTCLLLFRRSGEVRLCITR